jgi:hypothetical protein
MEKNAYNLLDLETGTVIQRAAVDIIFQPREFPLAKMQEKMDTLKNGDFLDPLHLQPPTFLCNREQDDQSTIRREETAAIATQEDLSTTNNAHAQACQNSRIN